MESKKLRICVVGAGIMGMSSAYCLAKEYPGSDITVYASEFPPNTTSNHGYGIVFCRHFNQKMYNRKIGQWSSETARFCSEITRNPNLAQKMGIKPIDGFLVMSKKFLKEIEDDPGQESVATSPSLRGSCTYFRESTESEVEEKFLSKKVPFNILMGLSKEDAVRENLQFYSYGTFIIDTDLYLLWLKTELIQMEKRGVLGRVEFVSRTVKHLRDLSVENFDVVINCSGLGAGTLADDKLVSPIRAQWILIRAPEINNLYYAGRTCICPRPGRVSLGSIFQWHRSDKELDPIDSDDNWRRAKSLFPDLQRSQILGEYVRLRPGRVGGARVEYERLKGNKEMNVIHNYGHAGTGIGQHWGCALNVRQLVRSCAEIYIERSKL